MTESCFEIYRFPRYIFSHTEEKLDSRGSVVVVPFLNV